MKKHCTPSNNAMHITAPISCSTVVPTESCGCINPIAYLISQANLKAINDNTTFTVAAQSLLSSGIYMTNSSKLCCPDCDDIYFLGFFDTFTDNLLSIIPNMKCCYNYVGPVSYLNQYPAIKNLPCCTTDFFDCIALVNQLPGGQDLLFSDSIFEYNSLNNKSGLCAVYEQLQAIGVISVYNELGNLLDSGIVVRCQDCKIFIGSAQQYFNIFID
jgi:hypothetical protein